MYRALFHQRLHIIMLLVGRFAFLITDYTMGHSVRFGLGVATIFALSAAYVLFYRKPQISIDLVLVGLTFFILSPTLTNGGIASPSTTIYVVGFAAFGLLAVGIDYAKKVLLLTLSIIFILAMHYLSGFAEAMNHHDDKRLLGLPIRETLVMVCTLVALLLNAKDYARKRRELLSINAKQEAFISHLNHEMRNPLQGIKGVLDVLMHQQVSPEKYRFLLENAIRTTEHLNDTVDEVLNIRKLKAGSFVDNPIPVNIRELVNDTVFIYEEQAKQKGLAYSLSFSEHLPVHISLPKKSFKIILSNLCSNAVKYTHQGHIALNLSLSNDKKALLLVVEDSGIGFESVESSHIFDEFYQVERDITKEYQGTGLGLSITKQLLDKLHGNIKVQSEKGQGTRFDVSLPCHSVEINQQVHVPPTPAIKEAPQLSGLSVLVVEDNFINRTILNEQLVICGISVVQAENGLEALEILKHQQVNIILSDIAMPKMDGLTLIKTLRAQGIATPCIAISGNTLPEEVNTYKQAGFSAVLSKPYSRQKLYELLVALSGFGRRHSDS